MAGYTSPRVLEIFRNCDIDHRHLRIEAGQTRDETASELNGIASARPFIEADGLDCRCRAIGGNFFESVPRGADLYVLKNVLHDWDDKSAVTNLKTCRRAIAGSGKLR
jgi:hypothetical protein